MTNAVPLRYRLLLGLLSPLVLTHQVYYAIRRGGGKRFLLQRLGFHKNKSSSDIAWLHAASVGEVNAALPLLDLLLKQYPQFEWLITTNTATGAQIVKTRLGDKVQHCYLPIDYHFAVKRFIKRFQPCCALIMETELWPNLYKQCQQHDKLTQSWPEANRTKLAI